MNYSNTSVYGMPESLFTSLKDIFEAISANTSRIGVVSPTRFLEVLKKEHEMFRSLMHQDAHEFLNLLLNEVVTNVEANAKKLEAERDMDSSAEASVLENVPAPVVPMITDGSRTPSNTGWVHELFEGTLTSETKCLTCETVSQRDEAFLDLSVDLDQHSSVTSCLRKFSEEEMLCERNKFHCDRCGGLQEAEKRMKIKRLPKILALHLKRFKYTEDLQRLQKLFHRIVFPYHLRLFNTTDDAEDPDRLYELYAVVVHIGGGPYHGHYVSIVKTQDRGWLLFDDELVEPVDKSFVRNFFGDRPGLACAYVLFYQETTIEAVKREEATEWPLEASQAVETPNNGLGLGYSANGVLTNGKQSAKSHVSPIADEDDHWGGPDRVGRGPPRPPTSHQDVPGITADSSTTSNFQDAEPQSKKERAKEEKERKAAEREQEKVDRAQRKTFELKRKENEKKQALDAKAAADTDRALKSGEDRQAAPETDLKTNNGGSNGIPGLSRFRHTSKSISKRPKFWSSKDPSKDERPADGEQSITVSSQPPDKTEKLKNRFSSLRRKKSNLFQ